MNASLNIHKPLLVGLGQSSMACAQFLQRQGCSVCAFADTREQPTALAEFKNAFPEAKFLLGDAFNTTVLSEVDALVLSPGFDPRHEVVNEARRQRMDVVGEVELFARVVDKPVMGITGTNGKSTVTVLAGELLKASGLNVAVGGNLGTPTVELLNDDVDVYVLELSSFQLETTHSLTLISATVLNISDDHADRYDTYDDYITAKLRIYQHAQWAIINQDDAYLKTHLPKCSCLTFSVKERADYALFENTLTFDGVEVPSSDVKLSGIHNIANVLAAVALVSPVCEFNSDMKQVLSTFTGLQHRMQWVANVHGVDYFNDSKATNVGATVAALEGLNKKVILIAGGVGKNQDFSPLVDAVKTHVHELVFVGEDVSDLSSTLSDVVPQYEAHTMDKALAYAHQKSANDSGFDAVLLSPACASFDQYKSFEDRGEHFMRCVQSLDAFSDQTLGGEA